MKVQLSQSVDYNQTLVFSVFGHLLILTAVLFLPKPVIPEKAIVPAFMVNLVSEPSGYKSPAPKRAKPPVETEKPKATKKAVVKKDAPVKPAQQSPVLKKSVTKPVETKKIAVVKAPNEALEALTRLEAKSSSVVPKNKNLMEQLDQVARLETKVQAAKPTKPKAIAEKTFRALEILKNKKIKQTKAVTPVPLHEDILEDFEELKAEETLPEIPEVSQQKRQESVLKKNEANKVNLLQELEQLAKLESEPVLAPKAVIKEDGGTKKTPSKKSSSYDPIIEKLGALSVSSEPITLEVSSAQLQSSRFRSKLRNLSETPQIANPSRAEDPYVVSEKEGVPGADSQSLYVGLVQEKIYKNWREPLAEEHNQETVVSFYIFPGGNIDKPIVKKSSGVEALDTLAVRAVLDSAPFPKFPEELKMSNLHVNIYFKYVPKD
ncbi:MAG: TonB family protein [Nitrospinaceae bacterium]|nr:TonB family protein [Nitrospinaceae bacterium]